jgi:hypothetical protein
MFGQLWLSEKHGNPQQRVVSDRLCGPSSGHRLQWQDFVVFVMNL